MAFVPARRAIVFCVDEQGDAADIVSDANAAIGGAEQKSAAEPPALNGSVDGQTAETKHRHVVASEAFLRQRGRPAVFKRRRAQRIEAEDARRRGTVNLRYEICDDAEIRSPGY